MIWWRILFQIVHQYNCLQGKQPFINVLALSVRISDLTKLFDILLELIWINKGKSFKVSPKEGSVERMFLSYDYVDIGGYLCYTKPIRRLLSCIYLINTHWVNVFVCLFIWLMSIFYWVKKNNNKITLIMP